MKKENNIIRILVCICTILILFCSMPSKTMAAESDAGDSYSKAISMVENTKYADRMSRQDVDYYRISGLKDNIECNLTFNCDLYDESKTDVRFNMLVYIYDVDSQESIISNRQISNGETNMKINLRAGREYAIRLSCGSAVYLVNNANYEGKYTIQFSAKHLETSDLNDAGDSVSTAKEIKADTWCVESIRNRADSDYFKVEKKSGKLMATIENIGDLALTAFIAGPNGKGFGLTNQESIAWVIEPGKTENISMDITDDSQYYVRVDGVGTTSDYGDYKVKYTIQKDSSNESNEQVKAFVSRLYTVALSRAFDNDGLNDWTKKLVDGIQTGAEVAHGFIFSEEFKNRNLSDSDFVDTLYRTMFNREPDADGKASWMKSLSNGMSREFVYHGFAEGTEFKNLCDSFGIKQGTVKLTQNRDQNEQLTAFVARNYTKALGRAAEEAGINDWTGRILSGKATPADVTAGFIFSPEFANKGLSNEEFLKVLYQTYFDRDPDDAGYNGWMEQLNNGVSREYVVNTGFSCSQEFANLVASFGL